MNASAGQETRNQKRETRDAESLAALRPRSLFGRLLVAALLLGGSALFLFPLAWMLSTALKPVDQVMQLPPVWLPNETLNPLRWEWGNFLKAIFYQADRLDYVPFIQYTRNTLAIATLGVTGAVLSNALIAYGFARIDWPGRDLAFKLTLATMMIPFPVLMVPLYVEFRYFGWIGTFLPLWVPAWFGAAFNIFLLRQFFLTIPFELSDAARVDGASEFQIFRQVILPLAKPALAVVALFHFLYVWNDFLGPLIFLTNQKMYTLAYGLQAFQTQHGGTPWNLLMAAAFLVLLPVVVLFFFTQRTFIQGIAVTGLKG